VKCQTKVFHLVFVCPDNIVGYFLFDTYRGSRSGDHFGTKRTDNFSRVTTIKNYEGILYKVLYLIVVLTIFLKLYGTSVNECSTRFVVNLDQMGGIPPKGSGMVLKY